jgi:hypothetical protein
VYSLRVSKKYPKLRALQNREQQQQQQLNVSHDIVEALLPQLIATTTSAATTSISATSINDTSEPAQKLTSLSCFPNQRASEAGLFQVTEFQILDVTPGITHLTIKSRMVILIPLATNFLFSCQEHNSTS